MRYVVVYPAWALIAAAGAVVLALAAPAALAAGPGKWALPPNADAGAEGPSYGTPRLALKLHDGDELHSDVVVERLVGLPDASQLAVAPTGTSARLGMKFSKPSSDAALTLALFRVQTSRDSSVGWRPRGGGVALDWRSKF